jgi:hypothetical protein
MNIQRQLRPSYGVLLVLTGLAASILPVKADNLDINGNLYALEPASGDFDVTPQAPDLQYYIFNAGVQHIHSYFTVYVDMPGPPPSTVIHVGDYWGHAWWSFNCGAPLSPLNMFMTTDLSHFVNKQVGYAPTGPANLTNSPPGYLRDSETGINVSVSKMYLISISELKSGLRFTQNLKANPGTYQVLFKNCVWETFWAGLAAGVGLPFDVAPENFGWLIYMSNIGSQ